MKVIAQSTVAGDLPYLHIAYGAGATQTDLALSSGGLSFLVLGLSIVVAFFFSLRNPSRLTDSPAVPRSPRLLSLVAVILLLLGGAGIGIAVPVLRPDMQRETVVLGSGFLFLVVSLSLASTFFIVRDSTLEDLPLLRRRARMPLLAGGLLVLLGCAAMGVALSLQAAMTWGLLFLCGGVLVALGFAGIATAVFLRNPATRSWVFLLAGGVLILFGYTGIVMSWLTYVSHAG